MDQSGSLTMRDVRHVRCASRRCLNFREQKSSKSVRSTTLHEALHRKCRCRERRFFGMQIMLSAARMARRAVLNACTCPPCTTGPPIGFMMNQPGSRLRQTNHPSRTHVRLLLRCHRSVITAAAKPVASISSILLADAQAGQAVRPSPQSQKSCAVTRAHGEQATPTRHRRLPNIDVKLAFNANKSALAAE
jgi:hypothetical protein